LVILSSLMELKKALNGLLECYRTMLLCAGTQFGPRPGRAYHISKGTSLLRESINAAHNGNAALLSIQ